MFGITGRWNMRNWEYALFHGSNNYLALPDVKMYEKLTAELVGNDCRIIMDSVMICQSTKNLEIKKQRAKLAKERYRHLLELKPFADSRQRGIIRDAEEAIQSL